MTLDRSENAEVVCQDVGAPRATGSGAGDSAATEPPQRGPGKPKGLPRTGGRKPGTPNKRTAEVRDLLLGLKCDPITGMARLAMNPKNSPDLRGRMYSELAQYMFPKRKALDLSAEDGRSPFVFQFISGHQS